MRVESSTPPPVESDERLLRRFVSGDAAACRAVERWAREILFYRRLRLTSDDVDDVVQEVVTGVWQAAARPGFRLRHGLRAFVRTVTLARAIDRVRRLRVRRAESLDEAISDPTPGPVPLAEAVEDSARLHAALHALDAKCRDIIRLHYFEDWPYARIAARERRSEATLRVRMFHCIRSLRERLRDRGGAMAR
jgi:RNA polymerase sigma factor (sigma-70 family)